MPNWTKWALAAAVVAAAILEVVGIDGHVLTLANAAIMALWILE